MPWLNILLEILIMIADNIPSWRILTNDVPALGSRATTRLSGYDSTLAAITGISSLFVAVFGISTVNRRTSHFCRRLPHELCEMARFLSKPGRLVEVVVFPLVTPGFDR